MQVEYLGVHAAQNNFLSSLHKFIDKITKRSHASRVSSPANGCPVIIIWDAQESAFAKMTLRICHGKLYPAPRQAILLSSIILK